MNYILLWKTLVYQWCWYIWNGRLIYQNLKFIESFFIHWNLILWLNSVIIFRWIYLQHITLIFLRTSVDVQSGCPWFFAWNSSNYRENKFDMRSTKNFLQSMFSRRIDTSISGNNRFKNLNHSCGNNYKTYLCVACYSIIEFNDSIM